MKNIPRTTASMTALLLLSATLGTGHCYGHGYIENPPARGYACKLSQNVDCGAIYWEPQSLEGPDGWPQSGPADGSIAAAGSSNWAPLNEQSLTRWRRQPMQAGLQRFTWRFTAPHVTEGWRYYITRTNWDPNTPLTRASFEPAAFCSYSGEMQRPAEQLTHDCDVPTRSGYHVILGVWNVGDTGAAFYNVIDADFTAAQSGHNDVAPAPSLSPPWTEIGAINPIGTLRVGDSITLRLFDATGELPGNLPTLMITEAAQGDVRAWPRLFAARINDSNLDLRAGTLNADGTARPQLGVNPVWAPRNSRIVRAEMQLVRAPQTVQQSAIELVSAPSTITTRQGTGTADIVISGEPGSRGNLVVSNLNAGEIMRREVVQSTPTQTITLSLVGVAPGPYQLTLISDQQLASSTANPWMFSVVEDSEKQYAQPSCHSSEPLPGPAPDWQASATYWAGDQVQYRGVAYQARWWSQGELPVSSDAWQTVTPTAMGAATPWSMKKTYLAGDIVIYRSNTWRNKWWNRGSPPSLQTGWVQLGNGECQ